MSSQTSGHEGFPSTFRLSYGVVMGLQGFVVVVGYSLLAAFVYMRPALRKNCTFLKSLAAADILLCIHIFMTSLSCFTPKWPFGDAGCQLVAFLGMAFTFVSLHSVAWLAVDRYYQACKPEKRGKNYNLYLLTSWALGIIGGLLPMLGFGEYTYETDNPNFHSGCLLNFKSKARFYPYYVVGIFFAFMVWPIYVINKYYGKLAKKTGTCKNMKYAVLTQMTIGFAPYAIYALSSVVVGLEFLPEYMSGVNNVFAKIYILINPYLYLYTWPGLHGNVKEIAHTKGKTSHSTRREAEMTRPN